MSAEGNSPPSKMANTILVVDDERNIVQLARLYLSNEGFRVEEANDGKQALENEPIKRFAAQLLAQGIGQDALDAVRADVDAEIEHAVQSAMAAPDPAPEEALEGLFV